MKKRGMILVLCLLISTPIIFGGCAGMTPAQEGAVGGAAVTQEFADMIGADGYDPTAIGAVTLFNRLVGV